MNFFAFSSILIIVTSLPLVLLVILKGPKKSNLLWVTFFLVAAGWGLGGYAISLSKTAESAFKAWQIAWISVILSPVLYHHSMLSILKLKKRSNKLILYGSYCLAFFFIVLDLFFPKEYLGGVKYVFGQFYWLDWYKGRSVSYVIFYIVMYWFLLLYAFIQLIIHFFHSRGLERNQLKYILIGSIFGWVGPINHFLIAFGINIYPFTNISVALYPVCFTYAIIKYRLLDVRIAITRAGLFIGVYTLVLGLPFAFAILYKKFLTVNFGENWWMVPLAMMAVLATVGPFFYISLQRRAENRLLREQKRYQDTLKHAAIGMTRIRNLRRLLTMITHIVTKTVRISFAAIYLHDRHTNEYPLQVFRGRNQAPIATLSSDSTLVKWLSQKREPLIYEEVKRQMQDSGDITFKALEANMRLLNASVIIPSLLDHTLTGFVVLGDKLSGQIYTPDDLSVFQVLASQAALAIENAQFYEEAKEMQAQIAQAEKMATVGTMADGLSHQINNRFYALSLIAGDSIDTIKMVDTSGCSPEVKGMISQINSALERIQVNVMQGGEVVKGILKYTRKGDEGLEPLTMDQILDGTIDMVQFKVKLGEIDIIRDYPKDNPRIKANLVQMQEVFFNFIDNAYDSIVERRSGLKEEGYRGKITITATPKDKVMQIVVRDNGMGVKSEDIKKIFTPFFTTKASSRKGTGLGLYVIRSIILETHQGKIDFSSEYKSGTSFTIEIPLAVQF
jgi:signal transduction histidine kinase